MTPGSDAATARQRLVAAAINATVFGLATVALGALFVWRAVTVERWRSWPAWLGTPRGQIVSAAASTAASVTLHRVRSPGWRALCLRRVDARTGGPETVRSAVTRALLQLALERTVHVLTAPHLRRFEARREQDQARRQALRDARISGGMTRDEAVHHLEQAPGTSCLSAMVRPLLLTVLDPLTALLSPRRQTLIERLAGVVVVHDR